MSTVAIENFLTASEAAAFIGCSDSRVRQLIREGELEAQKAGPRLWLISREHAQKIKDNPASTGRPRKTKKLA